MTVSEWNYKVMKSDTAATHSFTPTAGEGHALRPVQRLRLSCLPSVHGCVASRCAVLRPLRAGEQLLPRARQCACMSLPLPRPATPYPPLPILPTPQARPSCSVGHLCLSSSSGSGGEHGQEQQAAMHQAAVSLPRQCTAPVLDAVPHGCSAASTAWETAECACKHDRLRMILHTL